MNADERKKNEEWNDAQVSASFHGPQRERAHQAISSPASSWCSKASIHSSSPWTNLLASSLSILTNESILAHPHIDVDAALGRNICPVNSLCLRTLG